MKINRLFSIAAATMMMVACSSEDTALKNTPAAGPQMQFTATIAAPSSGTTRTEYTESGTDINVAWKVGDEIALIHNGVKDVATVKTVNTDGSATITGDITVGTNGEAVEVCYPAAAWEWYAEKSCAIRNETFVTNITTKQDGTLKYIQDNLDTRMGKGTLKVDGDKATLSDNVTLASQIAIWKLTMQDDATPTPAALKASQVSVKLGGEEPWTVAGTTTLGTATSTVYLAIDKLENQYLTIEATVGSDTYKYENEDISLALGQYYQSTVTMSLPKIVDLSTVTEGITIEDGYTVTGTLGANVKITIAAGATVTLDGVTINGENSLDYKWAGITCLGDATIILKDDSENTVKGFHQNYPGIYVPGDADNPANNKTLTIKGETAGTGILTASSNGNGAGIGGGNSINCGNIEIQGGKITATGGSYAAGIGGANSSSCGTITISGGTVTATCGANAAGIGSGYCGNCVDIIITGGSVTATGGNEGAGIGSGFQGTCGNISISGGTVEATGGTDAAGIGSGYDNSASCGDITISGGTVTATGGIGGAGIGSGYFGSCVDITISGGTVTATGRNEGAGIGSSFDGKCGNITITTGVTKVTATKGSDSPNSIGIGSGNDGSCGTVTIGCTLDNDGNPVGGTTGVITVSPYTYPAPTIGDVGNPIGFDGGGDPLANN